MLKLFGHKNAYKIVFSANLGTNGANYDASKAEINTTYEESIDAPGANFYVRTGHNKLTGFMDQVKVHSQLKLQVHQFLLQQLLIT